MCWGYRNTPEWGFRKQYRKRRRQSITASIPGFEKLSTGLDIRIGFENHDFFWSACAKDSSNYNANRNKLPWCYLSNAAIIESFTELNSEMNMYVRFSRGNSTSVYLYQMPMVIFVLKIEITLHLSGIALESFVNLTLLKIFYIDFHSSMIEGPFSMSSVASSFRIVPSVFKATNVGIPDT